MATNNDNTINREFVRKVEGKLMLIQEYGEHRYMAPIRPTVTRTERGLLVGHVLTRPFKKVS